MKHLKLLTVFLLFGFRTFAQLSGTYSIPGTYSTLASAIADLNAQGAGGAVTMQIAAGYTETAPTGGYTLYASGTSASPITFQKSGLGANPIIYAYSGGTAVPASVVQDGIWRFIGCDYITLDGIELQDPNTVNPATMEFGFGFFKAGVTDGCQNNTIINCVISLRRANIGTGAGPASPGSRGIEFINALTSAHTTSLLVTSPGGSSSNNKFYNNIIQNCNICIALTGSSDNSPYTNTDQNNDIGGLSVATTNTLINFGGGTGTVNPSAAVRALQQYSLNVSYNYIDNNDGNGVNHIYDIYGIQNLLAPGANLTVQSNSISLNSSGSSRQLIGVSNGTTSATSGTVVISSNLFSDFSCLSFATVTVMCVQNNSSASRLQISNNTFTNSSIGASGGILQCFNHQGSPGYITINNNAIGSLSLTSASGNINVQGIITGGAAANGTIAVVDNTIVALTTISAGNNYSFFNNSLSSGTGLTTFSNNILDNVTIATSGGISLFITSGSSANALITNNRVVGTFSNTGNCPQFYALNSNGTPAAGTWTVTNNYFSNIYLNGNTPSFVMNIFRNNSVQNFLISSNTCTNVNTGIGYIHGLYLYSALSPTIQNNKFTNYVSSDYIRGLFYVVGSGTALVTGNSVSSYTAGSIISGITVSGAAATISGNKIADLQSNLISTNVDGMMIDATGTVNVNNNTIGDFRCPVGTGSLVITAVRSNSAAALNLFYNSVYLNASSSGSLFGTAAIVTNTPCVINFRNNIVNNSSVPTGTGITSVHSRIGTSLTNYSVSSNNNIYYTGAIPNSYYFSNGTTNYASLSAFKTFVSARENLSMSENTSFQSTSGGSPVFLHISPPSLAESNAVGISGISTDYDADIRQGNGGYVGTGIAPDIGADEFNTPNCNSVASLTLTPASFSICVGQSVTLTRSDYPLVPGIQQQWQVSTTSGSSYTNIPSATGVIYTSPTLSPGTYYYVASNTCTFNSQVAISNEATVTVYSFPTINISPSTATVCLGGSPVTLNASGANTYTWSGSGLSSTTGSIVTASPTFTTTYNISGTNAGGCIGTASVLINVRPGPGTLTVTASPTLVCQGYSTSLSAGSTSTVYGVSQITYAPVTPPASGVGTLCANGSLGTFINQGNLDDGEWSIVPIPFNFKFFSNTYVGCSVSTNGFISLGSVTPWTYTGYGNALPSFSSGRPGIGAVYSNLTFSTSGSITYFTSGVTPNRKFVVSWSGGKFAATNTGTVTTQLILFETTNIIEVHTTNSTGQAPAVEGIQDDFATVAYVVNGRNNQTYTISNDAWRWSPALTYSWSPSLYLSSTTATNVTATNVLNSVTYTVSAIAGNGCAVSAVKTISVIPGPTVSITGGTSAICAGTSVSLAATGASNFTWSTGAQSVSINASPVVTTTFVATGTWTTNTCNGFASQVVTVVPNPTLSFGGNTFVCIGNTASLSISGADTYSWSTGSTNSVIIVSPNGTTVYSVTGTATAGNCVSVSQNTLLVYSNPTVSISSNSTVCGGNNLTLTATGANSYSWSNGANTSVNVVQPVSSGTFSVIGTNTLGGCVNVATQSITVIQSPTLTVTTSTTICSGQTAVLTVSGANNYLWNTGATTTVINVSPPFSTVYSVTGAAVNGCSTTATIPVNIAVNPFVVITGTNVVCLGQSVNLSASGAASYSWSTGSGLPFITITPSVSNAYSVTGTSAQNCTVMTFIYITVNPLPSLTITAFPSSTICAGESLTITVDAGPSNIYNWGDGSTGTSISTSPSTNSGYNLSVKGLVTGCVKDTSFIVTVDQCTGIKELSQAEFNVYPNPNNGKFNFLSPTNSGKFKIYDGTGKIILSSEFVTNTPVEIELMAKGLYLIQIENSAKIYKLVVQ